ncbi:MAG: SusC/RagA family TonB-linked outer membrane protein [Odoribacteraceae bacterium]|jgi:TonB-linked SusC/RagA family outer membrane protein|nr:SusC/RagA family TonB-linked outer membrane protein [Odoribacteraceae bacterium]
MKKNADPGTPGFLEWTRIFTIMKTGLVLLFACSFHLNGAVFAQGERMDLSMKDASLAEIFRQIRRLSNYTFVYDSDAINRLPPVSLSVKEATVEEVLDACLKNTGFSFVIDDDIVIIRAMHPPRQQQQAKMNRVQGVITDGQGTPLPGVNIRLKESALGVSTDANGRYTFTFPEVEGAVLVFSFIGMKTREVLYAGQETLDIVLAEESHHLEEVVVNGIFNRPKEHFTGSSVTFSRAELKIVSNQNVLQSLRSLDPSFAIIENNQWGSDPNRLPDIEIRGKSSVIGLTEEFGTDPNQPLFILDGFITTLATINDLSMDRVESITILKDAASTAIYGSRAANGVVVVETVKPEAGRVKVHYNGNFSFNWADLSDYNLMNAREKLTFERLAGGFGRTDAAGNIPENSYYEPFYYEVYREVLRGVDSYWLSDPLRFATTDKHNVFVEGGDGNMRYGVGISYGNTRGVMKGSNREVVNGNVRLMYRRGSLSVNNTLSIDNTTANREKVAFSRFSRANPYSRKQDENGEPIMLLTSVRITAYNPLWDMAQKSFDRTTTFSFNDQFELAWRVTPDFQARARFSIAKSVEEGDKFLSPKNSAFAGKVDSERGSYTATSNSTFNYNGDISLVFGKVFEEKHRINAVGGLNFSENKSSSGGYTVTGFVDDELSRPSAAMQYQSGAMPTFADPMRRSASFFLNTGYAYDDRYLVDANYRSDGSSVFGVDRYFTNTWSVGIAYNLHNEKFLRDEAWLNMFKLRFSIGNPGNQNFDDYISVRVYGYDFGNANPFGPAMTITTFANEGLEWQKTLDRNYGLDLALLNNRVRVNVDYFHKKTNPLLVYVGIPPSTGGSKLPHNVGRQLTTGITVNASYSIIKRQETNWSLNLNARHVTEKYGGMGDALKKFNLENQGRDLTRYYDGGSPNDLWAVRSLGIDPGTGRETFLTKEGHETFLYNAEDEVVVGNSRPSVEGTFGSMFRYRGFTLSFHFRYRLGGQIFMETLYKKIEVIGGDNMFLNQDKRALYDRWQKPGDEAKFRSIAISEGPKLSSRFVMDNNILTGESISFGYESTSPWLRRVGATGLTVRGYMNDIFRISTVKNERGIDYPFARSVSFSVGLRF